jgi:hypothetical protein
MLVEDHEVEDQPLAAQVFVRLQQIGHGRYASVVRHAHQHHRQVARDPELPEIALAAAITLDRLEVAQPRIADEEPPT